jgi:hypothetical protein
MPVRQRGTTWQVDVRLADGTRFRKTFPTEEMAREAEKAMKLNPQQRAIARYAARASRSKSADTARSARRLSDGSGNSKQVKSNSHTSPRCVVISQKPRRA